VRLEYDLHALVLLSVEDVVTSRRIVESHAMRESSGRAAKEILHNLPVAPACGEPLSISQNQHLITLIERLGGANVRRVHNHRAMNTQE
jgi:hypothetical protein